MAKRMTKAEQQKKASEAVSPSNLCMTEGWTGTGWGEEVVKERKNSIYI